MFLKKQLFFVCMLSVFFSHAMEKPKSTIAIRCTDGNVIGVPRYVAMQASTIRNCFGDAHEDAAPAGEKECSFDGHIVDFTPPFGNYDGIFHDVGADDELEPLDLSADTLKAVFSCIADLKEIKKIDTKEALVRVFDATDFLGAPKNVMRKLTYQAQRVLLSHEQPEYVKSGWFLNSLRSLRHEGALKIHRLGTDLDDNDSCVLFIEGQDLDTLKGIELVAEEYGRATIKGISFDKNNLKILDVTHLFSTFPGVNEIHMSGNHGKKLFLPRRLPDGAVVLLNDNKIKELPHFKVGENGLVDLRNNPLSGQAINIALSAVMPSFLEKNRHRIKTFFDGNTLLNGSRFLGIGLGACVFGSSLGVCIDIMREKFLHSEYPLSDLACACIAYEYKNTHRLVVALSMGFGIWGIYYGYKSSYPNNLVHQYKPGQVLIDNQQQENF